ncbi:MAG: ABC transporter substrate-binding protein [Alphaproteobacteria bacterium]|nr:ABC transporter substrate-binding protein [Alphaproteobacteria bacterium]
MSHKISRPGFPLSGAIGRRTLLGGAAALGAAATLPMPYLSAARAQGAGRPLRIAVGSNLSTLDPARATNGEQYIYCQLVYNGLTKMSHDLKVEPDLAERWQANNDLTSWTFFLRRGVKFHNGREVEAEDVVATFRRILDPATGAAPRTNYLMIKEMVAVDKYTVRFDLSMPYGGFADIMIDRQVKITPRDQVASLATAPIGTGPFKFKSYTPGDRLVLEKNPDYFVPGEALLDGVELRIIPEMTVRLNALQAGDVDFVWDAPPEAVERLRANNRLKVNSIATASWDGLILNNAIPPFNDVRVRRALHLAVGKADIVQAVLFGQGEPTHSPIPPSHPYFDRSIPVTRSDPAAARRLLQQAGMGNGVRAPLVVPVGRPVRERLGVSIAQIARAAGFNFEIQRVPFGRYSAEVSGKAPAYVDGYFARPTLDTATYQFYHSTGSWNERLWHYKSERCDRVLDEARRTADDAKLKDLYGQFQRIVAEDVPSYLAYSVSFIEAHTTALKNFRSHPMRWIELRGVSLG